MHIFDRVWVWFWREVRNETGAVGGKDGDVSMRTRRTLLIILICFAVIAVGYAVHSGARTPQVELIKLQAALHDAQTQTDRNLASKALADYWDLQRLRIEGKLLTILDADARSLFQKTAAAWRDYRSVQVDFEGNFYRGGSIQPLIENTAYASLTARRVKDLEQLYRDNSEH